MQPQIIIGYIVAGILVIFVITIMVECIKQWKEINRRTKKRGWRREEEELISNLAPRVKSIIDYDIKSKMEKCFNENLDKQFNPKLEEFVKKVIDRKKKEEEIIMANEVKEEKTWSDELKDFVKSFDKKELGILAIVALFAVVITAFFLNNKKK